MDYSSLFTLPNSSLLDKDFTLSLNEQKQYYTAYLQRHLFDENTDLVAQKFFRDVAHKIVLDNSFREARLLPHNILSCQAYIPTQNFKSLFGITSQYQFPTILCDENGIMTGKIPDYAPFDNFKLVRMEDGKIGVKFLPTDLTLIRDIQIERFIMSNQIKHIQLNLTSTNLYADFSSNECSVYPPIIRNSPDIYDTLYITDYFLKYIHYIFVQMAVFEKHAIETKQKTFLIGVREIDGFYKVSNIDGHAGFLKLINTMRLFIVKNKLNGNAELKESYSKKENHLNIYIQYEKISYSSEILDESSFLIQLQPLKPKIQMGNDGQELPLYARYILQFCNEYYGEIKKAFPIFERLENIYRLCGMFCIINYLETHENLENFTIDQPYKPISECVIVDTYASSIMCFGGLVLTPKDFVKVPAIPFRPILVTPPVETNKLLVIRRGLANAPIKGGCIAHSGVLQIYQGKTYLLEYGPKGVSQKEIDVPDIDKLEEFELNGEKWSKQMIGNNIPDEYDPETLKKIMENITKSRGDYHLINNNCHMAQEGLRRAIGLTVEKPYK